MKTNLPLPKTEKTLSRLFVDMLGTPFDLSIDAYGIHFTQTDADYIKKTIQTHKLYRFMNTNSSMRVRFFNLFVNDPECPKNVKKFLTEEIGRENYLLGIFKPNKTVTDQFMMDRWMETCR